MHCYCIFCISQKARGIAEMIRALEVAEPVLPRILQRKWVKGVPLEEAHEFLPGYVFLYAEEPIEDLYAIRRLTGVLRILGNRENGYELTGSDLEFARMLKEMGGTLGLVNALEEGTVVKLDRNVFGDVPGKIVKLDRGRRRAKVEFEFDGKTMEVWCGVEFVKKVR